jgi:hypothetical protein
MDDAAAAAAAVCALDPDRSLLARKARHAAAFARRHSFEDRDEFLDLARRRAAGQGARDAGRDVEGGALKAPSRRS